MRLVALVLVIALGGCNFAVKHPAITGGIVAGTIGLASCELASSEHARCFAISGIAGVGLALITAGALWLGTEDETEPAAGGQAGRRVDPTNLEPAPVFVPKQLPHKPEPKPEPPKPEPVPVPAPAPTPAPPS